MSDDTEVVKHEDMHEDEAPAENAPEPNFPQQPDVELAKNVEPSHDPVPLNPVPPEIDRKHGV